MGAIADTLPYETLPDSGVEDFSTDTNLSGGRIYDGEHNPDPRNALRSRHIAHPTSSTPGHAGYTTVRKPVDLNVYATKKTVAKGMLDLALLTSNANQLRYVLEVGEYGQKETSYYISIVLISLSIILQILIGIMLIFIGRQNVREDAQAQKADKVNNWVMLGVFLITIINVFISAFAVEPLDPGHLRNMLAKKYPKTD